MLKSTASVYTLSVKMAINKNIVENRYQLLLLLLQIPLLSSSAFRFYSPTMGWFAVWGEKMASGELYRDAFTPLPPLPIFLMGYIPTRFNQPLIAETIISCVIWLVFVSLLYKCVHMISTAKISFFAVLTYSCLYFSEPHDIVAGYFELLWVLILLNFYWTIKTIKNPNTKNIIVFILLTISIILTKQNFIPVSMFFITFIAYYLYRTSKQTFYRFLISTIVAYAATFLILYAFSNSIIGQLNGRSKKPNLSRLLENLLIAPVKTVGIFSFIFLLFAIFYYLFSDKYYKSNVLKLVSYMGIFSGFINFFANQGIFALSIKNLININLIFVECIIAGIWLYQNNDPKVKRLIAFLFIPILLITINTLFSELKFNNPIGISKSISPLLFYQGLKIVISALLLTSIVSISLGAITRLIAKICLNPKSFSPKSLNLNSSIDPNSLILLMAISLLVLIANSLSGGLTIQSFSLFFCAAFSFLLPKFRNSTKSHWQDFVSVVAVLSVLTLSIFQVNSQPYLWWGFQEDSVRNQNSSLADVGLPYFKTTTTRRDFLSEVQNIVKAEKDPESRIYFGPNIQGLKFLFDSLPTYQGQCAIIWWDVCPEEIAMQDFQSLRTGMPKFIVWNHFPESVANGHEEAFRETTGKSAVRLLNDWIQEQVNLGHYRILIREPVNSDSKIESWELVFLERSTK